MASKLSIRQVLQIAAVSAVASAWLCAPDKTSETNAKPLGLVISVEELEAPPTKPVRIILPNPYDVRYSPCMTDGNRRFARVTTECA